MNVKCCMVFIEWQKFHFEKEILRKNNFLFRKLLGLNGYILVSSTGMYAEWLCQKAPLYQYS